MSLDVTIIYHNPKTESYGETHRYSDAASYDNAIETEWNGNITHNCCEIAEHIPITDTTTLYDYVWSDKEENTNHMRGILEKGITYMITHKEYLEQWNPVNGWGSYESFLAWLLDYWMACIKNPGCRIQISK